MWPEEASVCGSTSYPRQAMSEPIHFSRERGDHFKG